MNRRSLLHGAIVLAMAPWASAADAVPAPRMKSRVILRITWPEEKEPEMGAGGYVKALSSAMAGFGFVEGENLELVPQWLPGQPAEVRRQYIADITKTQVDAIVVIGDREVKGTRAITRAIPIIAWDVQDPVALGIAESFVRPGGNVTGLTYGLREQFIKQVDFLRRAIPRLTGIAGMVPEGFYTADGDRAVHALLESAIRDAGLKHKAFRSGDAALAALAALRADGIQAAIYNGIGPPEIARPHAQAAIAHRVALMGVYDDDAKSGFLMSYGEHASELILRIAMILSQVLRGAKPAETPFMDPVRMKFTINRATAKALRITLPDDLLVFADETYG